jgi:hypothetical protein
VSFAALLRFKVWQVGALKEEVLPPALAFLTRQFLTFFDDIPFSVANDTNHFSLLALQVTREQQAFRISISDCFYILHVLFQAIRKNELYLKTIS